MGVTNMIDGGMIDGVKLGVPHYYSTSTATGTTSADLSNMHYTYTAPYSSSWTVSGKITISKYGKYEIKKIVWNPKKNATTVIFDDGSVEVVKKSETDPEADMYSVVAYAVAKHVYKTNSAFKKIVDEKTEILKREKK